MTAQPSSPAPRIWTDRLELIASTAATAQAEADWDWPQLAKLLDAEVTDDWPPKLTYDVLDHWAATLTEHPEQAGWWSWYFVRDLGDGKDRVAVGGGGFGGLPAADGIVQIGYSVLHDFQYRGYATEAMRALVTWAFSHEDVRHVVAATFADHVASLKVIEKLGMTYVGDAEEPGAITFGISRAEHARRTRV